MKTKIQPVTAWAIVSREIDNLEIYRAAVAIFAAVAGVTHAPLDVARRDCLEQAKLLAKEVKGD